MGGRPDCFGMISERCPPDLMKEHDGRRDFGNCMGDMLAGLDEENETEVTRPSVAVAKGPLLLSMRIRVFWLTAGTTML